MTERISHGEALAAAADGGQGTYAVLRRYVTQQQALEADTVSKYASAAVWRELEGLHAIAKAAWAVRTSTDPDAPGKLDEALDFWSEVALPARTERMTKAVPFPTAELETEKAAVQCYIADLETERARTEEAERDHRRVTQEFSEAATELAAANARAARLEEACRDGLKALDREWFTLAENILHAALKDDDSLSTAPQASTEQASPSLAGESSAEAKRIKSQLAYLHDLGCRIVTPDGHQFALLDGSIDAMACESGWQETVAACVSCGAMATRECDDEGQFVCGYGLCDNCEHYTNERGFGAHRRKASTEQASPSPAVGEPPAWFAKALFEAQQKDLAARSAQPAPGGTERCTCSYSGDVPGKHPGHSRRCPLRADPTPAEPQGRPEQAGECPPGFRQIPVYSDSRGTLSMGLGGLTTIRACQHCGVLIAGGPTACVHCVRVADRLEGK